MLVKEADEPLNATVMVAVVLVARADNTSTKSVYVPGIEVKSIVAAPATPTVAVLISCTMRSPHTKQKLNQQ